MRKVMALILGFVAYGFSAISALTIPNETISAGTPPQVVWVDQNFDSVTSKVNQIKDSINLYLVGSGNFLGTAYYSNSNLRLGIDNDANATENLFWFSHNATDSLFRIKDDSTWRAFGAGVGTKIKLTDSLIAATIKATGLAGTGTRLTTSTSTGAQGNATTIAGDYTLSGNQSIGGTLGVTGSTTLTAAPTFSAFSSGRIPMFGTAGLMSQDNLYWDATNDRLGIGSGASSPGTDLEISKGAAGTATVGRIYNTDNTNATSNAILQLFAGGSSGGDPFVRFNINGATDWSIGPDNSDADALVISEASTLGTNNRIRIASGGAVTIPGTLGVTGALSSGALTATTGGFSGVVSTTASGTNTSSSIQSTSANPTIALNESDQSANDRQWEMTANGMGLALRITNDAGSTTRDAMLISRAPGTIVSGVTFGNATDNANVSILGTGYFYATSFRSYGGENFTYGDTSFTLTGSTGWTTTPTGTAYGTRIGKFVTLTIPYMTGTSNSNNTYLTGLPASWTPATLYQRVSFQETTDNGVTTYGRSLARVDPTGVIRIYPDNALGWTASGTKAIGESGGYEMVINYTLQ